MTRYARSERDALADLLRDRGPDAPTLCAGWTTRDLAAHLVVRERRPDAAAGLMVPPLSGYGESVRARAAADDYVDLVDRVRRPPWWSPAGNALLDRLLNTLEFFVHHEDVRRAEPGWEPRELPHEQQAALWSMIRRLAGPRLRRFPAAITLVAPGHGEATAGAGGPAVRVTGAPAELALLMAGRQRVARVEADGPPALVDRLINSPMPM